MCAALHPDLQAKLAQYRQKRAFNPEEWAKEKCQKLNEYMQKCGLKACAVSVSGGVDSAVTAALCKYAQKMEGSPIQRVVGISQPIHSSAWALNRATSLCTALGVEQISVDQTEVHTQVCGIVEKAIGITGKDFARGQMRSYMRTPVAYFVAQLLSQEGTPCIVMGTGNQDEDGYLAYFCKAGDGVVDVQLISDLHKSEVFKVGAVIGVPEDTLNAPPSADLWEGQTDEGEMGFSYDFVELLTGLYLPLSEAERAAFVESLSPEGAKQFEHSSKAAQDIHRRNAHKLNGIVNL
eukprot:GGOE01053249.1.p1 GENE.GGOE01053249.1~~GGOE01053249.1.p1  ORF type:complete len:293 (-),score=49.20 GGOE01053249.1:305-1183(-)